MYSDLMDKTALITGSGKKSGIGYAIARKFASCGTNVIIADIGHQVNSGNFVAVGTTKEMVEIVQELKEEFGVETLSVDVDVTSPESIERMVKRIKRHFSCVDILCNNAGGWFGEPTPVHLCEENFWINTIDLCLHSVFRVSRAILPLMAEKGGVIINTASRAGKVPAASLGAYSVAKAGVIMLTKVMAKELAESGIRINTICPGQIWTDIEKGRFEFEAQLHKTKVENRIKNMCKTIPMKRMGTPEEISDLVVFLASQRATYITGQAINICGGQVLEL